MKIRNRKYLQIKFCDNHNMRGFRNNIGEGPTLARFVFFFVFFFLFFFFGGGGGGKGETIEAKPL